MAATMTTATPIPRDEVVPLSGAGLQRAGAVCALIQVGWLGVVVAAELGLFPALNGPTVAQDPVAAVTRLKNEAGLYMPIAEFILIGSATLGIVVLSVREHLLQRASVLINIGTMFGLCAAFTLLLGNGFVVTLVSLAQRVPLNVVEQGVPTVQVAMSTTLGVGLFTLGLWMGLLSLASLRSGGVPAWFAYLGLLTSIADVAILIGPPFGLIPTVVWLLAAAAVLFGSGPTRHVETSS